MAISAGNPVRLDPWQNIVNVGWPSEFPFVAGTREFSKQENSGDLILTAIVPGGSPAAAPGDLLVAHATAAKKLSGQGATAAIITPPAGWGEATFDTLNLTNPPGDRYHMGGGVWFKYLEAGDTTWDFTWNFDCARTLMVVRVVGARTSGFPSAIATANDDGSDLGSFHQMPFPVVEAPSVSPATGNNLILTVVHEHRLFNSGRLTGTAAMTKEVDRGAGPVGQAAISTFAAMFTENWPSGPTGTREIIPPDNGRFFLTTMAIAP